MRRPVLALAVVVAPLLAGCELEEITIVQVEEVVVAEIYANLGDESSDNEVQAYLHWTAGIDTTDLRPIADAVITVRGPGGLSFTLAGASLDQCAGSFPPEEIGACFLADPTDAERVRPADLLEVEVALGGGKALFGAARVPSSFRLADVPATCRLEPNALMSVRWSRAEGAWAYVNETSIRNLPAALESEGIVVEEDPLYLLGLAISDQDTTIVFPSEFGLFNRFELDQDVAVRLQSGLPPGAIAEVTITAVDRNFVNWVRGGSFNPSGQVRIASLRGDGTGVFGAAVSRTFVVFVDTRGGPTCPGIFNP